MFAKIIMELIKVKENTEMTSEKALCWAKRVDVQKAQSAIMNSVTDIREFD